MTFISQPAVRRVDGVRWQLLEDLEYRSPDAVYRVPVGYITDFASVPRATSWLIPRTGDYTPAAILHDWLITDILPTLDPQDRAAGSIKTDRVFREVMKEMGVPWARRWVMWAGVRLGALGNPLRRPGSLRTFPLVLLVLLLSSPVVLPPSLVVQLTTGLLWLISLFVPDRAKVDAQKT